MMMVVSFLLITRGLGLSASVNGHARVTPSSFNPVRGSVVETNELLGRVDEATEACINDDNCEVDEFMTIRVDLEREKKHFQEQLSNYADDGDDSFADAGDVANVSGATAEAKALQKYIVQMLQLHNAISRKLRELDTLLERLRGCNANVGRDAAPPPENDAPTFPDGR